MGIAFFVLVGDLGASQLFLGLLTFQCNPNRKSEQDNFLLAFTYFGVFRSVGALTNIPLEILLSVLLLHFQKAWFHRLSNEHLHLLLFPDCCFLQHS